MDMTTIENAINQPIVNIKLIYDLYRNYLRENKLEELKQERINELTQKYNYEAITYDVVRRVYIEDEFERKEVFIPVLDDSVIEELKQKLGYKDTEYTDEELMFIDPIIKEDTELYKLFTQAEEAKLIKPSKSAIREMVDQDENLIMLVEEYINSADAESNILDFMKNVTYKKTSILADKKYNEIKLYLAGGDISLDQEERYKYKYELAKKAKETGDYSAFIVEATAAGITPEQLVDIIINMGDEWSTTIANLGVMIDTVRVAINKLVANVTNVNKILEIEKLLKTLTNTGIDAKVDEILALIEEYTK